MKDGERSSERERERFVLKLVKKKEVAKRKEVPRDKRNMFAQHTKLVQHSNRSLNRTECNDNRGKNAENNYSETQIMSKGKDIEWKIANTESSPRLFSRSTNHLRYFETNIISRVIFLISFLARIFKILSR